MRRTMVRLLMLLALAAALAACDIPEFSKPNMIKRERVLAIRAEPREVMPGETVTITGLAVNKDGTPYVGPIAWVVTGSMDLAMGDTASVDNLPKGEYFAQIPGGPPFTFTMPTGRDFEDKFGPYSSEGVVLTIAMAVGDIQNNPILGIKSLIVRDTPVNENPAFNEIQILKDGEAVEPDGDGVYQVDSAKAIKLVADVDFPTGNSGRRTFHWYTRTEGLKKYNVEKAQEWNLPKKAGKYDLYCVARENTPSEFQGGDYEITSTGEDWKHAVIEIQ